MKYLIVAFLVILNSCRNDEEVLSETKRINIGRDLYQGLVAYHRKKGNYPTQIEQLKDFYSVDESKSNVWKLHIEGQWNYEKPNSSKRNQVILRDNKYGVTVEVSYQDNIMKLEKVKRVSP